MPDADNQRGTGPEGGDWFTTTHWSVVLAAGQTASPQSEAALEELCRTYWYPLYAFARRQGSSPEDAQDLTQGFFARFLEKNYLDQVQRGKGKFRCFLLASLKHFLADERDKARALKRGGGKSLLSLDDDAAEGRYRLEPVDKMDAEKLFERRWTLTLLEEAGRRLKQEYAEAGKSELYDRLKVLESGDSNAPRYSEVATLLGLTDSGVKTAVFRMRQRYRELVRAEVANTVENPSEVDEELRYLIGTVSG
jgi:RNA polymerase sigma-70 factor (ECF subfamily)